MARGRFITLEGGEGAGKSTQVELLAAALSRAGIPVLPTREPGGSQGAEEIRELLIHGAPGRWDAMTEALLHFAARREHLLHQVWPALEAGTWVVSDRFADSTMAYQGYGHGLGQAPIQQLYNLVVGDFRPDLTLILDLAVESGLQRAQVRGSGGNRYEQMDRDFHQRLRQGFLEIAAAEPGRCVMIDAAGTPEEVHRTIWRAVTQRLKVKVA